MTELEQASVDRALASRRSVRAFLPTPVPRATLEDIFTLAARTASGTNCQPWRVHVLTGARKEALSAKILNAFDDPDVAQKYRSEFPIYPSEWVSPFVDRRRKVGWDLYGLLGIGKGDHERTHRQHARNFTFFDAPVGLIFTIHRSFGYAAWIDYGMFLGNVMTAARARDLDTCPQFAWAQFHTIITEHLALPAEEKVLLGMALGHEDTTAIENTLRTERAPLAEWVSFDS
ncbi:MAG: nitroreductase [Gammaproteobacteria bacterium]|nr:nitroreductase [Gammaproteobacteria bacterium]